MRKRESKQRNKFEQFIHNENTVGYIFAAPYILGFLAFTIIPMCISLYYSLTDYKITTAPNFIGLANYTRMVADSRFFKSIWVTLKYVVVAVPLKLVFALLVAVLLTKKTKLQGFYRSVYYLPSLIGGSVAVALVWKEIFAKKGLVSAIYTSIGLQPISWFGSQTWAFVPLVLMTVWQFGSSMIIFAAGLKQIPLDYYEASKIDGANSIRRFFSITLPCLSPIILFNLIMQLISGFMSFTQAFVITKGGPNDATNFISLYIYNQAFKYFDMGYASALSWILLLIITVLTAVIFKTSKHWVFYEAGEE